MPRPHHEPDYNGCNIEGHMDRWQPSNDGWALTTERCRKFPILVLVGSTVINMAISKSAAIRWIERYRKLHPTFRPTAIARATDIMEYPCETTAL